MLSMAAASSSSCTYSNMAFAPRPCHSTTSPTTSFLPVPDIPFSLLRQRQIRFGGGTITALDMLTAFQKGRLCLSCDCLGHPMPRCPNGAFVCPNCSASDHRGNECTQECRFCGIVHPGISTMHCMKDITKYLKGSLARRPMLTRGRDRFADSKNSSPLPPSDFAPSTSCLSLSHVSSPRSAVSDDSCRLLGDGTGGAPATSARSSVGPPPGFSPKRGSPLRSQTEFENNFIWENASSRGGTGTISSAFGCNSRFINNFNHIDNSRVHNNRDGIVTYSTVADLPDVPVGGVMTAAASVPTPPPLPPFPPSSCPSPSTSCSANNMVTALHELPLQSTSLSYTNTNTSNTTSTNYTSSKMGVSSSACPCTYTVVAANSRRVDNAYGRTLWVSAFPVSYTSDQLADLLNNHLRCDCTHIADSVFSGHYAGDSAGGGARVPAHRVVRVCRRGPTGTWAYVQVSTLAAAFFLVTRKIQVNVGTYLKLQFRKADKIWMDNHSLSDSNGGRGGVGGTNRALAIESPVLDSRSNFEYNSRRNSSYMVSNTTSRANKGSSCSSNADNPQLLQRPIVSPGIGNLYIDSSPGSNVHSSVYPSINGQGCYGGNKNVPSSHRSGNISRSINSTIKNYNNRYGTYCKNTDSSINNKNNAFVSTNMSTYLRNYNKFMDNKWLVSEDLPPYYYQNDMSRQLHEQTGPPDDNKPNSIDDEGADFRSDSCQGSAARQFYCHSESTRVSCDTSSSTTTNSYDNTNTANSSDSDRDFNRQGHVKGGGSSAPPMVLSAYLSAVIDDLTRWSAENKDATSESIFPSGESMFRSGQMISGNTSTTELDTKFDSLLDAAEGFNDRVAYNPNNANSICSDTKGVCMSEQSNESSIHECKSDNTKVITECTDRCIPTVMVGVDASNDDYYNTLISIDAPLLPDSTSNASIPSSPHLSPPTFSSLSPASPPRSPMQARPAQRPPGDFPSAHLPWAQRF